MRFLLSLLPLLAYASAQLDYDSMSSDDFETDTGSSSSRVGAPIRGQYFSEGAAVRHELPLGVEAGIGLRALSKWDKTKFNADRFGRYEVNPEFNLDGSRSLNLKMTPILNFQKTNMMKGSFAPKSKIKMAKTKGQKIMLKLLSKGIKPSTVKKFLWAKKQGLIDAAVHPINVMLAIQRETADSEFLDDAANVNIGDPISSSSLSSFYNVNPQLQNTWTLGGVNTNVESNYPMMATNFQNQYTNTQNVEHGVVIPNIKLARELQQTGVVVTPTIMNQPAIEINHLKDALLSCENVAWNNPACTKLNELAVSLLGESSITSKDVMHQGIVNLQNKVAVEDLDIDKLF